MRHLLPVSLFAVCLTFGSVRAQWVDGELVVLTDLPTIGTSLVRIDPASGGCQVLASGFTRTGASGAVAFDTFRDGLVANVSMPPDPYWLGKLWVIRSDGTATAIPGLTNVNVRALCSTGDGRIFFQDTAAPNQIRWLDAANTVHTLLDTAGAAPFSFPLEHLLWHPASNSLLATNSGWWSTNHCAPATCSIFRIPLTPNGTRVASAPTCASFATGSHEVMNLDYLPGGDVLLCLANGSFHPAPKLLRVDPWTLTVSTWASPQPGDLDGGYYCAAIDRVVVLDDASNVLRRYPPGGSGVGSVLATTLPVSSLTSGYSPTESMWRVDRNGPGCHGAAIAYGNGTAGTGGFVPTLGVVGCPDVGAPFTLSADRLVGGTLGLIGLGDGPANLPALGGTILVFPITATVVVVGNGAVGMGGAGTAGLPLQATNPALLGTPLWFQGAFLDAGGPQGWSLTNGLQIVIG